MKYVQFDYVNKFSCLAGKCPDTCCKDWQIILDEDAIARYASLPGELGEQVRAAMLTENGETRFRERGGNCVLLRDDGLCPLQAAYGAEMLCRTCFTHPRFTEEYGQTAELTLSASCPEAARLLLEHDAPLTLTETDDGGPVIPNELDPALYPALLAARTASIRLAQDRARPVADRLALILLLARRVQRLLDEGRDELVPVLARRFLGKQYQDRSLVRLGAASQQERTVFPVLDGAQQYGASDAPLRGHAGRGSRSGRAARPLPGRVFRPVRKSDGLFSVPLCTQGRQRPAISGAGRAVRVSSALPART